MVEMVAPKHTKRVERKHLDNLAKVVNRILEEDFGGLDTKGSQTRFAKEIGVSQSHISQMSRGGSGDRGVGLPVLIAIRDYLVRQGRPATIDDLLGLDKAPAPPAVDVGELRRLREAVEQIHVRLEQGAPLALAPQPEPPRLPPARRRRES